MPHQTIELWPLISLLIKDYMISSSQYKNSFVPLGNLAHSICINLLSMGHESYSEKDRIMRDVLVSFLCLFTFIHSFNIYRIHILNLLTILA